MRLPNLTFALAALGIAIAQPAAAHTKLAYSTPAANATVAAPARIELRFNEAVIGATARAEIIMTAMPGMTDHPPMPVTGFTAKLGKDGKSMTLLLRRPLAAGTYRVTWNAAGADTHRMGGNFSFTVR